MKLMAAASQSRNTLGTVIKLPLCHKNPAARAGLEFSEDFCDLTGRGCGDFGSCDEPGRHETG